MDKKKTAAKQAEKAEKQSVKDAKAQEVKAVGQEAQETQGAGPENKEAEAREALQKALDAARASAQRYSEGRADVVVKLFPIADNLDRAYAACADEATKKGVSMVLDAFNKLLAGERIEVIDPVGEAFDAEKHEAIMAVDPAEGEESGTVKQVYLKGYERDGKVLRFAQVVVTR